MLKNVLGARGCAALRAASSSLAAAARERSRRVLTSAELEGLNLDIPTKVTRLYRAGLSRDPDAEGRANAEAALKKGTTWKALVHGIATSPEATGYAAGRCAP